MAIGEDFFSGFGESYGYFTSSVPGEYSLIINVFIFAILISIYSIFTWKFYRNISKKNVISLNLSQYNRTSHPMLKKFIAGFFYLFENIIIMPILIFIWFGVLGLIITVLAEEQASQQIIVVAAAIIAAIRILAYYEEDLSADLAKIFPFTILSIFALNPNFFQIDRVIERLTEIPPFLNHILYFLVFIAVIEMVLRVLDLIMEIFRTEEEDQVKEE